MARHRDELSARAEKLIAELAGRGATAEVIAKQLRAKKLAVVSARTIGRRLRELRGNVRAGRVSKKSSSSSTKTDRAAALDKALDAEPDVALPSSPESIPEGLGLEVLHRMRKKAERAANAAMHAKDLANFAAMGRLVTSLNAEIRKATPPKQDDPNENPDMRELAEEVGGRLHKLIDQVAGTSEA